jgi:hypothetical protein
MTIFQIVFITFCVIQAALALRRFLRTRQITSFVFLGAWSLAIVLIADPGLSQRMAQSVGIGRGVDFVTYSLLIAFLWAHYQHYLRYRRVENEVTLLVRELAIAQATRSGGAPRQPAAE